MATGAPESPAVLSASSVAASALGTNLSKRSADGGGSSSGNNGCGAAAATATAAAAVTEEAYLTGLAATLAAVADDVRCSDTVLRSALWSSSDGSGGEEEAARVPLVVADARWGGRSDAPLRHRTCARTQ